MNPADEAVAPNQPTDTPAVSAPEDMDLSAINEAIAQSANEAAKDPQNTFDVEDISLDNTPTTDAELEAQKAKDPDMSLAGANTATADPLAAPAATPVEKPAETAGFVDGDLVDDPEQQAAPVEKPDYDAIKADPVESFDENAAAQTVAANPAPVEEEKPAEGAVSSADEKKDEKKATKPKLPKKSIDFNAILHNNNAVIGIVAGIVLVVIIIVVLVAVLS